MIKRSRLNRIIMMNLVSGTCLLAQPATLLANNMSWQPQISEKILMLPSKHLEQAIELRGVRDDSREGSGPGDHRSYG